MTKAVVSGTVKRAYFLHTEARILNRLKCSVLSVLLLSASAACVATSSIPLYDDVGIRLSGVLSGALIRHAGCYAIAPGEGSSVILILPRTAKLTERGVALAPANGGRSIAFGEAVTLRGGYTEITADSSGEFSRSPCKGEAFLVNSVDPPSGD